MGVDIADERYQPGPTETDGAEDDSAPRREDAKSASRSKVKSKVARKPVKASLGRSQGRTLFGAAMSGLR